MKLTILQIEILDKAIKEFDEDSLIDYEYKRINRYILSCLECIKYYKELETEAIEYIKNKYEEDYKKFIDDKEYTWRIVKG